MKTRKTAGSSIQKALIPFCGRDDIITPDAENKSSARNTDKFFTEHPHPKINDVRKFLGDEIWNSYFKFAFVRNPWSLVVSRYHWNKRGVDCSKQDFKIFLTKYCSKEAYWGPAHYYVNDLQQNYTCINGQISLDYIGKIETLHDDFKFILNKLNLPYVDLPKSKSSFKPKYFRHYTEYYTEDLIDLVSKYFSKDIKDFEYTYNQEIVTRRIHPIVTREMLPNNISDNINGPSLIKVPEWIDNPLGKYYLYFAHHQGNHIRLAYSDEITGPYKLHDGGTLKLEQTPCKNHIASPDVHIDEKNKKIILYYHGDVKIGQKTFMSVSDDGLEFISDDKVLGEFYFRVFQYKEKFYSVAKNKNEGGVIYESDSWDGEFKPKFELIPNMRHSAVYVNGDFLFLFYTCIGDMPESIFMTKINLKNWKVLSVEKIIEPKTQYEGANLPMRKSMPGSSTLRYGGMVNELRDPYVYIEKNKIFMLYSLAGEFGIGLTQLYNKGNYGRN